MLTDELRWIKGKDGQNGLKKKKKGKIQFYAVFKRFTLKAQIESKGGKSYTIQMVSIRLNCLN